MRIHGEFDMSILEENYKEILNQIEICIREGVTEYIDNLKREYNNIFYSGVAVDADIENGSVAFASEYVDDVKTYENISLVDIWTDNYKSKNFLGNWRISASESSALAPIFERKWRPISYELIDLLADIDGERGYDQLEKARKELLDFIAKNALLSLLTGILADLPKTKNFRFAVVDHNESIINDGLARSDRVLKDLGKSWDDILIC